MVTSRNHAGQPAAKKRRLSPPDEEDNKEVERDLRRVGGLVTEVHPYGANGMFKIVFQSELADTVVQLRGEWAKQLEPHLPPGVEAFFEMGGVKPKQPRNLKSGREQKVLEFKDGCVLFVSGQRLEAGSKKGPVPAPTVAPVEAMLPPSISTRKALSPVKQIIPPPAVAVKPVTQTSAPNLPILDPARLPLPVPPPQQQPVRVEVDPLRTSPQQEARAAPVASPAAPQPQAAALSPLARAVPEVSIRRNKRQNEGAYKTLKLGELRATIADLKLKRWDLDSTYIDIVGHVSSWTVQESSGGRDSCIRFDITSSQDHLTIVPAAVYIKSGRPVPRLSNGCPIAFFNLRWKDYAGGQVQGPSNQWPYTAYAALTPHGERLTFRLHEIYLDAAHLDRVFARLEEIRLDEFGLAPRSPPAAAPAPGIDAAAVPLQAPALVSGHVSPGPQPVAPVPVLKDSKGYSVYQPRVVDLNQGQHGVWSDILVQIRGVSLGQHSSKLGSKRLLWVTDWTTDDRFVSRISATRPGYLNASEKTDVMLSVIGDELVKVFDASNITQTYNTDDCVVHFKGVYFSQKGDDPIDMMQAEKNLKKLGCEPFRVLTLEDKEASEAYKRLAARRSNFMSDANAVEPGVVVNQLPRPMSPAADTQDAPMTPVDVFASNPRPIERALPDPPGTQRGYEKRTLVFADAAGSQAIPLTAARKLAEGERARVNVRCNGFQPDIKQLSSFRQLVCAECVRPAPLRALVTPCNNCGTSYDWMQQEAPCCANTWPRIPEDGFSTCDRCNSDIQLSYVFSMKVVEAQVDAGNISHRPTRLAVFGDEADAFIGIAAPQITQVQLEERLAKLSTGDRSFAIFVQGWKQGGKSGLRLVSCGMQGFSVEYEKV